MNAAIANTVVSAHGLRKAYKNKLALDNTSFEIEGAEVLEDTSDHDVIALEATGAEGDVLLEVDHVTLRCGGRPVTSRPSISTYPASGSVIPATTSKSVVLPAPLGPIRP